MQESLDALAGDFKAVFRDHPAAVTIITALTPEGPVGLTASSVASVAVDPTAISFSVTRATGTAGALLRADELQVHFLAPEHAAVATQFSFTGGERFAPGQGWSVDADGAPRLAGARARLNARILDTLSVGGSVLVVAQVTSLERDAAAGDALLYADRQFFSRGDARAL
ncbi:flavin reductase family protein [Microbacterium excoecariae]|uniref:flavin reductase family protein n=1 Tax=Microbacterium excoecariae TaxID=2715210 RepID=UPI00140932CD|nr:flavin reductase family protein [Microbacterium excoecariae]NHI16606.1 flavin reductase [Microbacterium excoecariae]